MGRRGARGVPVSVDSTIFCHVFYNLQQKFEQNLHLHINPWIYNLHFCSKAFKFIIFICYQQIWSCLISNGVKNNWFSKMFFNIIIIWWNMYVSKVKTSQRTILGLQIYNFFLLSFYNLHVFNAKTSIYKSTIFLKINCRF